MYEMTLAMTIVVIPNTKADVGDKLADVELHFHEFPFTGLKLVGFAVWKGPNGRNRVSFPARSYTVNGEKRQFALLRPIEDRADQEKIRGLILKTYAEELASQVMS